MRLKYQLFLALLLASALLILLMYVISSWSFSRGLLDYVNQATTERANTAAAELEVLYQEKKSWDWVHRNSPEWQSVVADNRRSDSRGRPPGPKGSRYILADTQKRVIMGPRNAGRDSQWIEIEHEGSVVGYLGYRKLSRLDTQLDRAFEEQQTRSFAYAGTGMVLLCALLAVPMAALVLRPLLKMGDAVEHIRQGDYTRRLASGRKDELGELSRNINQLALTLEANRGGRQRWIAEISHELRTPMAVLRAEIEAMQDGVRPLEAAAVDSLHAEIMRLNRLVNDLHTLSLSDIGALDYRSESLILEPLLMQFLDNKSDSLADASLSLLIDLGEPVSTIKADAQRLQQLFSNLYQNSLRYTDAGGSVVIRTRRVDESQVQILWSDSSPGVPAEDLPKLFDPLYRVEQSRSRASGGSGLGLSIVSRIVKAHDGFIDVSASELGGLQIDIRLPLH